MSPCNEIQKIFTLSSLYQQWKQKHNQISKIKLEEIEYLGEFLPKKPETNITGEEYDMGWQLVYDFEEEVRNSNLDDTVKIFFLNQIEILKKALRDYLIIGRKAFDNGVESVFKNVIAHKITGELNSDHDAILTKLATVLDKFNKWVDRTKKLYDNTKFLIGPAEEFIDKL